MYTSGSEAIPGDIMPVQRDFFSNLVPVILVLKLIYDG